MTTRFQVEIEIPKGAAAWAPATEYCEFEAPAEKFALEQAQQWLEQQGIEPSVCTISVLMESGVYK